MHRSSLTLVLVFTLPALSGCLGFPFLPPADGPRAEAGPDQVWLTVDPGHGTRDADAYAFWIPEAATGLRLLAPTATDDDDRGDGYGSYSGAMGPRHLAHYDDRILVYEPDGDRIRTGPTTVGAKTDGNTTSTSGTDAATLTSRAPAVLFQADDPPAGRYTLVVHGTPELPVLSLRLPRDILPVPDAEEGDLAPVPLVTLPRAAIRHHVATIEGPGVATEASERANGSLVLPPHPLLAWGDMLGTAADARLRLHTDSGDVHTVRETLLVRPPGEMHGGFTSWAMFPGMPDPLPLREDTMHWTFDADGQAMAFATILALQDAPRPVARPVDLDAVRGERLDFEGRIRPGEAGVVQLTDTTRLGIRLDNEDDPDRGSAFRLYDLDGKRLGWGDVRGGETLGHALPAGPVLVVNDGRYDLALEAHGAAPADITIVEADTRRASAEVPLDVGDGPAQARRPWKLPGPVLHWASGQDMSGSLQDMVVYVERGTAVLAQTPSLYETGPDRDGCCAYFGPSYYVPGDPTWLDGGDHSVRVAATAGSGTMYVEAEVVDLAALRETFAGVLGQDAEHDRGDEDEDEDEDGDPDHPEEPEEPEEPQDPDDAPHLV